MSSVNHRSHRKLGEQLDLFHFPVHAPGSACWHPRGLAIYQALEQLSRDLNRRHGYIEVRSPLVCDNALWERSGHADKFADKMFSVSVDERPAAIKPMNCPGHADFFSVRPRSYRELPLRVAELGHVHRREQSGEINGLLRARSFVIDDAHLFCRPEQAPAELAGCLELARGVYDLLGLPLHAELSLRPDRRIGSDAQWDAAEQALRDALDRAGVPFVERPGEGAFYGPKVDLHVRDSLGRAWQMGSVQIDYQLPGRFELSYINEHGKPEQPVIIHRALFGSVERLIGILIEHFDGRLPLWLAPEPVRVLPVSSDQAPAALGLADDLERAGVRAGVELDGPLGGRIRDAAAMRIPLLVVLGQREIDAGQVSVRGADGSVVADRDAWIGQLAEQVAQRRS